MPFSSTFLVVAAAAGLLYLGGHVVVHGVKKVTHKIEHVFHLDHKKAPKD